MSDDAFRTAVQRLHAQIGHWEAPRWQTGSRADLVHALVQELADLAADAEQRPHRTVPREAHTVLPDQLRVVAADLIGAAPAPGLLERATARVATVRSALAE